ncbi:MAG TPA: hypothetical protein VG895_00595, partial [Patescibacteria group bacterium]|nr:hypothetical protein [Gammaproteobacteria bacterium]HWA51541.1 hypothetical protein [Patescibacteria group bacterium]
LFHTLYKICSSFLDYFLTWSRWGYGKRYLYHLDGVEEKGNLIYLSLHIRGRRAGCTIPINSINEEVISEVHPVDACFIGALSISTDASVVSFLKELYSTFKENKQPLTTVKTDPLLAVTNILSPKLNEEKLMIYPKADGLSSAMEIKLQDIVSNPVLLTGLGSKSAFRVDQEISRKLLCHEQNFRYQRNH